MRRRLDVGADLWSWLHDSDDDDDDLPLNLLRAAAHPAMPDD